MPFMSIMLCMGFAAAAGFFAGTGVRAAALFAVAFFTGDVLATGFLPAAFAAVGWFIAAMSWASCDIPAIPAIAGDFSIALIMRRIAVSAITRCRITGSRIICSWRRIIVES